MGFLFARIKSRNSFSRIKDITTEDGQFSSHKDIAEVVVAHFQWFFNASKPANLGNSPIPIGATIPTHFIPPLTMPVTDLEIKKVVFARSSSKAPGPDDFTFEFYKGTWEIIGNQLYRAIIHFFYTGFLPKFTKATTIVLIPKGTHASTFMDFRPISHCNVFL